MPHKLSRRIGMNDKVDMTKKRQSDASDTHRSTEIISFFIGSGKQYVCYYRSSIKKHKNSSFLLLHGESLSLKIECKFYSHTRLRAHKNWIFFCLVRYFINRRRDGLRVEERKKRSESKLFGQVSSKPIICKNCKMPNKSRK